MNNIACPHCALIYKLKSDSQIPVRKTAGSVGLDFFSPINLTLKPQQTQIVFTNLAITPPEGYYLQIKSRSYLASQGIITLGGTIDTDFNQNIGIILKNVGQFNHQIKEGDRIAQGIFLKFITPSLITISGTPENQERGGFGSTGV